MKRNIAPHADKNITAAFVDLISLDRQGCCSIDAECLVTYHPNSVYHSELRPVIQPASTWPLSVVNTPIACTYLLPLPIP
jgi:hypothetical protein